MSAIQQALSSYGAGVTRPLDGFTTNLWAAFSISKLLTAYGGDALTAVNTTTTSSAAIGFDGNSLDTAALATLAGSDTCVVSEFLNQEGTSGRKFSSSGSSRPRIVNSGTYDGKLVFDGSDDALISGAASGTPSAFTVFFRGLLRSTSGTQIIVEHSPNYNSNDAAVIYYDTGSLSVGVHRVSTSGFYRSDFSGTYPNNNTHCWRMNRDVVLGGAAGARCFVNGVVQTRTAFGDVNTMGGDYTSQTWYVGARGGTSLPSAIDLHTLVIYEGALSDADILTISTAINAL